MKLAKLLAAVGTLAAAGMVLAACGKSSATKAKNQTLNWATTTELTTLDSSKVTDTTSLDQISNTMEGLYRLGKNGKPENGLATQTTVSTDGKTYTFTLRKGAKWSNGQEVTAADFVFAWRRTVNPKTGSEYAYIMNDIKNATAIQNGKKAVSSLGVTAVGKYKLVVTLNRPVTYFKKLMSFGVFFPQNQTAVKKYGAKYGTASQYMVYDGPFVQSGWTGSNLSWHLSKNPNYWDKKAVKLTQINYEVNKSTTTSYNLYQSNKMDVTALSAEQSKSLSSQTGYTVEKGAWTYYLAYNMTTNKYLKNTYIRKAISLAINRSQLAQKVIGSGSTAATGFVTAGLVTYNGTDFATAAKVDQAVAYNTKLAKQYWQKGLQQLGVSKVTLTLLGDDTDTAKSTTDYLQSALETNLPGLTVSVANVPKKTRITRSTSGDFDIVLTGWGADYADPSTFLDLMTTGTTYNFGKWNNAQYTKLVTKAETTDANNEAARFNDFVQAEKLLMQNQGVSPLYFQNTAYMIRPTVKGLVHNATSPEWNLKHAYVTTE